ncbi:MAG: tryptophan synthase subunit alpha [Betaproteobacteria bacterium]|nr:tryptophan synthase subunit alpha [Betaproteobacteria bacterium]NBY05442.1 tryptophan synthase subunit alpha [Betaproteobacteria bacterium]
MSRITPTLQGLKDQGRKALIPYLMAGFPKPQDSLALMHALVDGGADIIELGVPFSDPMADGPVIQLAAEAALRHNVGMSEVLDLVRSFRQTDPHTPVVLMGYANPVESYNLVQGAGRFVKDAAAAGVDGVLIVDYPPEECVDFADDLRAHQMDLIFLLAPTSTEQRMKQVAQMASGYVYYVSLKGVTGSGALNTDEVEAMLPRIRQHVHIPVGVGFGIRDAQTAQTIGQVADAVVIGSKLIQLIEAAPPALAPAKARQFMAEIRQALDTA